MAYTKQQAARLARQIRDRFLGKIQAVETRLVPADVLAMFIGTEAGKRAGRFVEEATRYEPHVFGKLKALRDGRLSVYNGIRQAAVKDASDTALRNLATSFGLTQIMGWHILAELEPATIAELRDPDKHLGFAVRLLRAVATLYLERAAKAKERGDDAGRDAALAAVGRIWNSGSPDGKTYDPDYVENQKAIRDAFNNLQAESSTVAGGKNASVTPYNSAVEPASEPKLETAINSPENSNATETTSVQAPEGSTEIVETKNEQNVNEIAIVEEPKPAGFLKKLGAGVAALFSGTLLWQVLEKLGAIALTWQAVALLGFIAVLAFLGFIVWFLVDAWKQNKRTEHLVAAATDPKRRDLEFVKQGES